MSDVDAEVLRRDPPPIVQDDLAPRVVVKGIRQRNVSDVRIKEEAEKQIAARLHCHCQLSSRAQAPEARPLLTQFLWRA